MTRGLIVAIEGGDGLGKTFQITQLYQKLDRCKIFKHPNRQSKTGLIYMK